jgi:Glycosyltransferase WbsX
MAPPLFLAMLLPQFHRDAHNDLWWGDGFTEWNNVHKAKPLFEGHQQPRLPLAGYFDLACPDEIERQWAEAQTAGIDGFVIYDYWYDKERVLHRPLDIIQEHSELPVQYSLAWANHAWTRTWTNRTGALDVLIRQTYPADAASRERHYRHLFDNFVDDRYIRFEGKPLFQIYNPTEVAAKSGYIDGLRDYCQRNGSFDIEVNALLTGWKSDWSFMSSYDSATLFQPSMALFAPTNFVEGGKSSLRLRLRDSNPALKKAAYRVLDRLPARTRFHDYSATCESILAQAEFTEASFPFRTYQMAIAGFDNTPRYGVRARILQNQTTEAFSDLLYRLRQHAADSSLDAVFVNSWNEWGEGAHIQPDSIDGDARLSAVGHAKRRPLE